MCKTKYIKCPEERKYAINALQFCGQLKLISCFIVAYKEIFFPVEEAAKAAATDLPASWLSILAPNSGFYHDVMVRAMGHLVYFGVFKKLKVCKVGKNI